MKEYLRTYQLYLIPVFLAFWLVAGTYIIRWALKGATAKRMRLSRCLTVNFLSVLGGLVAAVLVGGCLFFLLRAGNESDEEGLSKLVCAVVAGIGALLTLLVVTWLAMWNLLSEMPRRFVHKAALCLLMPLLVLIAVLVLAAVLPVRADRIAKAREDDCNKLMTRVRGALEQYRNQGNISLPPLASLVEKKLMQQTDTHCPIMPEQYIIAEGRDFVSQTALNANQVIYVIEPGTHAGGRMVMTAKGTVRCMPQRDLDELLAQPENQKIAELWKKTPGH